MCSMLLACEGAVIAISVRSSTDVVRCYDVDLVYVIRVI